MRDCLAHSSPFTAFASESPEGPFGRANVDPGALESDRPRSICAGSVKGNYSAVGSPSATLCLARGFRHRAEDSLSRTLNM